MVNKKRKLKMSIKILISIFILVIASIFFIISFFLYSLTPVAKNSLDVKFNIKIGSPSISVIENLKNENLIKNKYIGIIYFKMYNYSFKAGTYILNASMSLKEIFTSISSNNSEEAKGHTITFVEGKRITYFVSKIADNLNYSEEEIMNLINNKEFLTELIEKYWFINDIILQPDIYYPLEGYLFPDTYTFKNSLSIKDIIIKLLDNTERKLNTLKDGIENSNYSVHELLTLASIIELEGGNADDRNGIAGVFYNRLNSGWTLGSDVTTYYAAKKDFDKDLTKNELAACNAYNTRGTCVPKLPIGPIANPSIGSINAAVYPKDHNYFYFVADKYGKTYFNTTGTGHDETVSKLKKDNLWYIYQN